jgi:hypothetical protein
LQTDIFSILPGYLMQGKSDIFLVNPVANNSKYLEF